MKLVLGTTFLVALVLATSSCRQIQSSLREFAEQDGPEALSGSDSLAGQDRLPVVTDFRALGPSTFESFTSGGDRVAVVEFYSDT